MMGALITISLARPTAMLWSVRSFPDFVEPLLRYYMQHTGPESNPIAAD
jgi:hypothetical protein